MGHVFGGFKAPHVKPVHRYLSVFMGATMWFWVFYRLREDYQHTFLGYLPWEHPGKPEVYDLDAKPSL